MTHSGVLTVIYTFVEREGEKSQSGDVRLQDWHTLLGFNLRRMIWEEIDTLFSEYGLVYPARLRLWNGDGQPMKLKKKLGGDIFPVGAPIGEVFVTLAEAKTHDQPWTSSSAGTSAAPSNAVTARIDAPTVSDSFVNMAASTMSKEQHNTLILAAEVELYETHAFQRYFGNLMDTSVWNNMLEPHQLELVLSQVKGWVDLPAYLSWENCSWQPAIEWSRNGVMLRSVNDILLYHLSHDGCPEHGGILGITVKKNMKRRDVFQALGVLLCWGEKSRFPFVQLFTDMVNGGFAIFATGKAGEKVHIRKYCYVNMEDVKDFVRRLWESCLQS